MPVPAPPDVHHPVLIDRPPAGTRDGELVALDLATGQVRWRQPLPAADGYATQDGNIVVVAGSYGPVGAVVTAYAADSGAPLWRWPARGWLDRASYASNVVTVGAGAVTVGHDGGITVLAETTGTPLWSRPGGTDAATTGPAVVVAEPATASRFPAASTTRLTGLAPRTGRLLWTTKRTLRDVFAPVTTATGVLAQFHPGTRGATQAVALISAADGHERWRRTLAGSFGGGYPPVTGSVDLLALSTNGQDGGSVWIALDPKTGHQQWRTNLGESLGQPALAAGRIYAGSRAGTIEARDAQTGRPLWTRDLHRHLRSGGLPSLAASADLVVVPTTDGVTALTGATGTTAWDTSLRAAGGFGADHLKLGTHAAYVVMAGTPVPSGE